MFDEYYINNLVIGNRVTIYNVGGEAGITTLTDGPYIFYKVPTEDGKKQKYIEIFTEEVFKLSTGTELQKFGKTYVVKSDSIVNFLLDEEITKGFVNKNRLLDIYNQIRAISLEDKIQKIKR